MDKNNWKYDGYVGETTDHQKVGAFDTTYFEYDGQCYYITPRDTKIFITTVDPEDLTTPTGPRVQISGPDRSFERNLGSKQDIEEGPGVLLHDGRIFVTYSCATVDMHYGVCLVYADLKIVKNSGVLRFSAESYRKSVQVNEDTWDVMLGNERTLLIDNNNYENPPAGLAAEGVHAYKIGEYYYFFMIQGAGNLVRQQICWRSKTLEHGTFEVKKVFTGGIVDEEGKTVNSSWGVAQGGIVQTSEGEWYSIMFQDYHSVGRIPVLVPVSWGEDGWPVFGNDGKSVDQVLPIPISGQGKKSIVQSDEFDNGTTRRIYDEAKRGTGITAGIPVEELEASLDRVEENEYGYNGSNLKPVWQWNHNPNNNLWSLTDREGYLRLKSGLISKNIREARNTLTQRTFGPTSSAVTVLEVGHMREGDVAGLTAFQNQYGFVGIKIKTERDI